MLCNDHINCIFPSIYYYYEKAEKYKMTYAILKYVKITFWYKWQL
jgi:hypothetical protein